MVDILTDYCPQNHPCPVVNVCPMGAISQKDIYSAPEVDEELCTECGDCTNYCNVFRINKQEVA